MSVDLLRSLFADTLELEVDFISADTDFFLAGGHSLAALTLAVSLERAFDVPVKVRDIFECATPADLYARIQESSPVEVKVSDVDLPLDSASRWLWMERQRGEVAPSAYNVACLFQVGGHPDIARLEAAIAALYERHPILRTTFVEQDGEPRAVVHPHGAPLQILTPPDHERYVAETVNAPFDLATGPLVRLSLLQLANGRNELLVVADHLVCDGRGLTVFADDLVALYTSPPAAPAVIAPRPVLDTAPSLAYWRSVAFPAPLPLPIVRPRQSRVDRTALFTEMLDPAVVARLGGLAAEAHGGAFVPLAAGVAHALSWFTGSPSVCLGTPVDLRTKRGLDRTIGFNVATVPLSLSILPDPVDFLAHVAAVTIDAVDHSDVAYGELIAHLDPPRQPWRTPLFDVWVALYPYVFTSPAAAITLQGGPIPLRHGMFELSFQFVEKGDELWLVLQYDPLRYDEATVSRLVARVVDSLAWLAGAGEPAPAPASVPVFGGFRL